jgi:type I restriction enzyme S subunit
MREIETGSTMKHLNVKDMRKWLIPCPPIIEQQKIAKILSIWDNAIRKTEQLIQEKTILKKGIMQQLLTSRRRFKEFEGEEWINFIFGQLGEFYNGLTGKNKEDFGSGYPYIPFLNIINNSRINPEQMDYVTIKPDENQNKVKYGDIFFTTSSETPEEAGMPSVLLDYLDTTYLNSFCFGFRPKDFLTMNPDFARFYFRSKGVRKEIFKLAQGSTRYNISKSEIMKFKIRLPSVDEQQKIASLLSGLEHELSLLIKMQIKIKSQKRGLMQKLLTGEVRVKTD